METTKKTTAEKLQEVITAKTMEAIASAPKAEVKKETPKKEAKPRAKKTQATTEEKAVKAVKKQAANNLMEEVISKREVKYLYPDDIKDTLSRKKWRQSVRAELRKLETAMLRIENKNSKEFKKAEREFLAAQKKYMKKGTKVA